MATKKALSAASSITNHILVPVSDMSDVLSKDRNFFKTAETC
jgi:hypothetical protein